MNEKIANGIGAALCFGVALVYGRQGKKCIDLTVEEDDEFKSCIYNEIADKNIIRGSIFAGLGTLFLLSNIKGE